MLNRENVLKKKIVNNNNNFNFEELSSISKINIRGDSKDKDFTYIIEKLINITLPIEPNTSNYNDKLKIIWLGPNEWLIEIYKKEYYKKIYSDLKNSLNSQNTAITDITEHKTIIKLTDKNLYKLLSKFMIIDLDKVLKKKSSVAQTIFIKVPVLLIRNHNDGDEKQSINIHTNRSHAQYIIDLIIDGSKNIDF